MCEEEQDSYVRLWTEDPEHGQGKETIGAAEAVVLKSRVGRLVV